MARQRRRPGLRLGDQRTAVAVGRGDEVARHVVAEERDARRMAAVGQRQRAADLASVLRIGERRLRAERDVRQIDAVLREGLAVPNWTLPPSTTPGSVILTVPPMPELM